MLNVEMHIDGFAEFVFIQNVNDAIIDLNIPEIEGSKDLFFFCVDLLCKGLVLLYGNAERKVLLENLKKEDFIAVKNKMENAGIKVQLDIQEESEEHYGTNLHDVSTNMPDDMDLPNYPFIIYQNKSSYRVTFSIFHNTK